MDLRWIIRVSALVAATAAGLVFARWEDPEGMLGGFSPVEVVNAHDRARLLLREGRYDEGVALARTAVEREPRRAVSWELLATLHERRGDEGDAEAAREARLRAIGLYERAIRRGAWMVAEHDRWYRLGWLHRRVGDEREALACFERARLAHLELAKRAKGELGPDFLYNMACLAALSGRREDALVAWERANQAGFVRFNQAAHDPNLDSIRDDPRFTAALEVGLGLQREQQERLRELREQYERERAPRDAP